MTYAILATLHDESKSGVYGFYGFFLEIKRGHDTDFLAVIGDP